MWIHFFLECIYNRIVTVLPGNDLLLALALYKQSCDSRREEGCSAGCLRNPQSLPQRRHSLRCDPCSSAAFYSSHYLIAWPGIIRTEQILTCRHALLTLRKTWPAVIIFQRTTTLRWNLLKRVISTPYIIFNALYII